MTSKFTAVASIATLAALTLTPFALSSCSSESASELGDGTPTPTPSRTPLSPARTSAPATTTPAAAGPCAGTGAVPALPLDTGGSAQPEANAYAAETLLSSAYLGEAADTAIELALISGRANEAVVATQTGQMYRVALDRSFAPQLWGDLSGHLDYGGEQGLLSVAFSPSFEQDCRIYAYYTRGSPQPSILSRFHVTPSGLYEDSEEVLLQVPQPFTNHNGGHIAFDAAGYLYLSTGDGGSAGDPQNNGQNVETLLGKILRIDVAGAEGYAIPPDNPFASTAGRDEIFALGMRNPWRMTIDPVTDEIWLLDVGQNSFEEVDRIIKGGNYGWNCYEGFAEFDYTSGKCDGKVFQSPRAVYARDEGTVGTGGVVYHGAALPELYGWYIYADYASGNVWGVDTEGGEPPVELFNMSGIGSPVSFALAWDGDVYIITYNDGIYRLASP